MVFSLLNQLLKRTKPRNSKRRAKQNPNYLSKDANLLRVPKNSITERPYATRVSQVHTTASSHESGVARIRSPFATIFERVRLRREAGQSPSNQKRANCQAFVNMLQEFQADLSNCQKIEKWTEEWLESNFSALIMNPTELFLTDDEIAMFAANNEVKLKPPTRQTSAQGRAMNLKATLSDQKRHDQLIRKVLETAGPLDCPASIKHNEHPENRVCSPVSWPSESECPVKSTSEYERWNRQSTPSFKVKTMKDKSSEQPSYRFKSTLKAHQDKEVDSTIKSVSIEESGISQCAFKGKRILEEGDNASQQTHRSGRIPHVPIARKIPGRLSRPNKSTLSKIPSFTGFKTAKNTEEKGYQKKQPVYSNLKSMSKKPIPSRPKPRISQIPIPSGEYNEASRPNSELDEFSRSESPPSSQLTANISLENPKLRDSTPSTLSSPEPVENTPNNENYKSKQLVTPESKANSEYTGYKRRLEDADQQAIKRSHTPVNIPARKIKRKMRTVIKPVPLGSSNTPHTTTQAGARRSVDRSAPPKRGDIIISQSDVANPTPVNQNTKTSKHLPVKRTPVTSRAQPSTLIPDSKSKEASVSSRLRKRNVRTVLLPANRRQVGKTVSNVGGNEHPLIERSLPKEEAKFRAPLAPKRQNRTPATVKQSTLAKVPIDKTASGTRTRWSSSQSTVSILKGNRMSNANNNASSKSDDKEFPKSHTESHKQVVTPSSQITEHLSKTQTQPSTISHRFSKLSVRREAPEHFHRRDHSETSIKIRGYVPPLLKVDDLKSLTTSSGKSSKRLHGKSKGEDDTSDTFVPSVASEFLHSSSDEQTAHKKIPRPGVAPGRKKLEEVDVEVQEKAEVVATPIQEETNEFVSKPQLYIELPVPLHFALFKANEEGNDSVSSSSEDSVEDGINYTQRRSIELTKQKGDEQRKVSKVRRRFRRTSRTPSVRGSTRARMRKATFRSPKRRLKTQQRSALPVETPKPSRSNERKPRKSSTRNSVLQFNSKNTPEPILSQSGRIPNRNRTKLRKSLRKSSCNVQKLANHFKKQKCNAAVVSRNAIDHKKRGNKRRKSTKSTSRMRKNPNGSGSNLTRHRNVEDVSMKAERDYEEHTKLNPTHSMKKSLKKKVKSLWVPARRRKPVVISSRSTVNSGDLEEQKKRRVIKFGKWKRQRTQSLPPKVSKNSHPFGDRKKLRAMMLNKGLLHKKREHISHLPIQTDFNLSHTDSENGELLNFVAYISVIPSEIDELVIPFRACNRIRSYLTEIQKLVFALEADILETGDSFDRHSRSGDVLPPDNSGDQADEFLVSTPSKLAFKTTSSYSGERRLSKQKWLFDRIRRGFGKPQRGRESLTTSASVSFKANASQDNNNEPHVTTLGGSDDSMEHFGEQLAPNTWNPKLNQRRIIFWQRVLKDCHDQRLSVLLDRMARVTDRRVYAIENSTGCRIRLDENCVYSVHGLPCMELKITAPSERNLHAAIVEIQSQLPEVSKQLVFIERFCGPSAQGVGHQFPTTNDFFYGSSKQSFHPPAVSTLRRVIPVIEEAKMVR